MKTLADFDWTFNPKTPKTKIVELASARFVDLHSGVLLIGPPGVGESHIATAIAIGAIRAGRRALVRSTFDLAADFAEADATGERPDPCPCGNPLPAIRPKGRTADVLTFPNLRGEPVKVPLLAFGADVPGVEQFQIVQTAPATLRVQLRVAADADRQRVWEAVRAEITRVLAANGLDHVTVQRADEPPQQTAGGKYREIIPFSAADSNE